MECCIRPVAFILLAAYVFHSHAREAKELMNGDSSYIYTPTEFTFDRVWFLVAQRTFFSFKLRACSDGHIFLANTNNNKTYGMTDIKIGGWTNSRSVIRKAKFGDTVVSKETPGILHCAEFRRFWISWDAGVVRLGRGPVYGQQEVMSAQRMGDLDHPVNVLYISTGFGYSGTWKIEENSAYYMRMKTPDNFNYIYLWKTLEYQNYHYTFEVSACSDVHIALGSTVGVPIYEVVLGGWENKRSVIRVYRGDWKDTYEEDGVLQCNKYLMFWITWFDNTISVGRGDYYEEGTEFLSWKDPNPRPISAMSITTGYGATGNWGFDEDLENRISFWLDQDQTDPSTIVFNHWVTVFRRSQTFFNIDSDGAAYIGLQRNPTDADRKYAIFIGEDGNTKCGVIDLTNGDRVLEVTCKNILWGERQRPFWLSWSNGVINFGRGGIIGDRLTFSWDSGDPSITQYLGLLGFANLHPNGAQWMVKRDMGDQFYLTSKDDIDAHGAYITVKQEFYKVIQIQAAQEAHIFLSRIDGHVNEDAFHIAIGEQGGTMTRIRRGAGDGEILAEASTPDIISGSGYRNFWIGWLDNYVRFGKGWRYGQNEILSMPNPDARSIASLALASTGAIARWRINSDAGDFLVMRTSSSQLTSKWIKVYPGTEWFYFYVSGSAVKLALGNYRDPDNAYVLTIGRTSVSLTRSGRSLASADVALMNEKEIRPFWVSFVKGNIRFGRWRARDMQLQLEYSESGGPSVDSVGIASLEGTNAEWYFMDNTGVELTFDTPGGVDFQQVWLAVRHINYAVFSVKACGSAHVLLSSVMFSEDNSHNYIITIGAEQNSKTQLRMGGTGGRDIAISSVDSPSILSCNEERFFWLSWFSGDISLGQGTMVNKKVVFSWQDLSPVPIHAMAISTSDNNEGVWRYSMTREPFPPVPFPSAQGLTGGEIAGAVIGFLVLFALFGGLVYVILRPPQPLQQYLGTQPQSMYGEPAKAIPGQAAASGGFDNPNVSFDNPVGESTS